MKLYYNISKRLYKKLVGWGWYKIQLAKDLKAGDLIATCKGYNEVIKEITPEWTWFRHPSQAYVWNFDITTESGSSCSLGHCCTMPLETRDEIFKYWQVWALPENIKATESYGFGGPNSIVQGILDGLKAEDIFDENGQPLYEFARDYEKKMRFPERYAQENTPA